MDFGLKGKVALVTGSTRGLGKAICEVLAMEGTNLIIVGRNQDEVERSANRLARKYNVDVLGIAVDLSQKEAAGHLFTAALAQYQGIDILVNNAGIWPTAYVVDMDEADFERTLRINLEIPFILSKKMARHLLERKQRGKIINIVSQAAFHGSTTGHAHYAASKGGLVAFTLSLAREMAKHGICVNAVAPGIMRTPMTETAIERDGDYYRNRIPLGRVAEPEEVAYSVAFLASNKADYLTGITLDATGGMLMR